MKTMIAAGKRNTPKVECADCGAMIPDVPVPGSWDAASWRRESKRHRDGCAFVAGRGVNLTGSADAVQEGGAQ